MDKKTDNGNLDAKLALRRYFLRRYHEDGPISVFDCCQGDARIWSTLRAEFKCQYWGVDLKPKKGRMKIDSMRVLQQPGWRQNVIDIDTYGSPWAHWCAMLPNLHHAATVFLTICRVRNSGFVVPELGLRELGLRFSRPVPKTIWPRLFEPVLHQMLSAPIRFGLRIVEVTEAVKPQRSHALYYGVRLEPAGTN